MVPSQGQLNPLCVITTPEDKKNDLLIFQTPRNKCMDLSAIYFFSILYFTHFSKLHFSLSLHLASSNLLEDYLLELPIKKKECF